MSVNVPPPPPPPPSDGSPGTVLPKAAIEPARTGLFRGKKALAQENAELRVALDSIGAIERARIQSDIAALKAEHQRLMEQHAAEHEVEETKRAAERTAAELELSQLKEQIVTVGEEALLQEVGVYKYRHPLDSAVAYKGRIATTKDRIKVAVREGRAVTGAVNWTVNGSAREGSKMVRDFSKLMLRAYNNEADNAVRSMRPYTLDSAITRLTKARSTILRLGQTMQIQITDEYHSLRIEELTLTADYLAKTAEEKERQREERERMREDAKVQKELERERAKLIKEAAHYQGLVERLRAQGDEAGAADALAHLEEVNAAVMGLEEREANIRAGYVYVISNIGSFGDRMVKIGMTRRLEPMDRVRELGDASVPFRYDVHALIFSKDAVGLETRLHQALAAKRVNLVNMRREFFYAEPRDVLDLLEQFEGKDKVLSFEETPEAEEWHISENSRPEGAGVA
jgi:hypothetical protein